MKISIHVLVTLDVILKMLLIHVIGPNLLMMISTGQGIMVERQPLIADQLEIIHMELPLVNLLIFIYQSFLYVVRQKKPGVLKLMIPKAMNGLADFCLITLRVFIFNAFS